MTVRGWALDPDGGGVKIPERTEAEVRRRLEAHAAKHFVGRYRELRLRLRLRTVLLRRCLHRRRH